MAMSAEYRSKFAALHQQSWRLHMSEVFSSGTIIPKQKIQNVCLIIQMYIDESNTPFVASIESRKYPIFLSLLKQQVRSN